MKQTSIEWLVSEIEKLIGIKIAIDETCVEQAKEMHKQEIIDAYQQGYNNAYFNNPLTKEQYYNETYNK